MLVLGLVEVPIWLILCLVIFISSAVFMTKRFQTFSSLDIPGPRPWPLLGNFVALIRQGLMKYDIGLREKYGDVVGTYMGFRPSLIVYDEEIINQVAVKQFYNFTNRTVNLTGDDLFDYHLLNLEDEQWKKMRNLMSPTFTTGKLKMMSKEINRCARQFAEVIASEDHFEAKDSAGAFTMDVIASTAFGLNINSQKEKDNLFIKHGKAIMSFNFKNPLIWIMIMFPSSMKYLRKWFGVSLITTESIDFFREVTRQTIENKQKNSDKKRADFLQLMVNAMSGEDIRDEEEKQKDGAEGKASTAGFTMNHIMSNAFLFFLAGYETTSVTMSLLFYCIATNEECQEKLYNEIESVIGEEEDIDYATVAKMPYLEQCINECLRMYPPGPRVDRKARQDIEIKGVKIPKGMSVVLPIYALQNDPKLWNEPEKFDPERFSTEEKAKRNPLHWMPFGYGPRNCIGLRLALFEIKISVVQVLRKYKVTTCEKTTVPIEFEKTKWLKAKNGLWLKVVPRA